MNKILKSCLGVLVLLAIAKVLVAQPEEAVVNAALDPGAIVIINQETGEIITMNEMMDEGAMEMNEAMPAVEEGTEMPEEGGGY